MPLAVLWSYSCALPRQYFHFVAEFAEDGVIVLDNVRRRITCLELESGIKRWARKRSVLNAERADSIMGATDGVLVMAEFRHDGPWYATYGIYRYDLSNGNFLGASHGAGGWGRFVRWLDWVPDFTNELRQTPVAVREGHIFTDSGRVIGARDGEWVREIGAEELEILRIKSRAPRELLRSEKECVLPDGAVLKAGTPDDPDLEKNHYQHRPLQFFRCAANGTVEWTFDALALDWDTPIGHSTLITERFDGDGMVMLVREKSKKKDEDPFKPSAVPCFLTRLDLKTGAIGPQLSLEGQPLQRAQFHEARDGKVLVSWSDEETKTWQLRLLEFGA